MAAARSHLRAWTVWITVLDLACLLAGGAIGLIVRIAPEERSIHVFSHVDGWLVFFGSMILANYLAGAYRMEHTFSRFNLFVTWMFSLGFALLVLSITSYAWFRFLLGRGVLALSVISYGVLSLFVKLIVYHRLFRSRMFLCRVAVLGTAEAAREVRGMVENPWILPAHKVVAAVDLRGPDAAEPVRVAAASGEAGDPPTIAATPETLETALRELDADVLVLARPFAGSPDVYPHVRRLRFEGIEVVTLQSAAEIYAGRTPLKFLDEEAVLQASLESGLPLVRQFKRLFDIVVAAVGLAVCAVPCVLVAVAVKLTSRGRVFYSQQRVGQFGRVFRLYKFRTMREDAEARTGPVWAEDDDARVTPAGRFLRPFRLDEIPQFWNVLRGDMSLVGPRPERPELTAELEKKIPFYGERANVPPGVTGWAQIRHPYGRTVEDAARKLEYDLYYIKHLSFSLDVQILLQTLRIVLFRKERNM